MKIQQLNISLNQQNYLETIYDLCENHGHAHTKMIAEKLGIKMASVTEALRSLSQKGLVNYEVRKTITLTELGLNVATELERRHKIIADFLHNILGCPVERADEAACRIEHVIDEKLKDRFAEFAQFIKNESDNGDDLIGRFQKSYQDLLEQNNDTK